MMENKSESVTVSRGHRCQYCKYTTSHTGTLTQHIQRHRNTTHKFVCDLCPAKARYRTTYKLDLNRHKDRHHLPHRGCFEDANFNDLEAYQERLSHERVSKKSVIKSKAMDSREEEDDEDEDEDEEKKQTKQKKEPTQNKCPHCGYIPNTPSGLKPHLQYHSRTTGLVCDLCMTSKPFRATRLSNLRVHKRLAHADEYDEEDRRRNSAHHTKRDDTSQAKEIISRTNESDLKETKSDGDQHDRAIPREDDQNTEEDDEEEENEKEHHERQKWLLRARELRILRTKLGDYD